MTKQLKALFLAAVVAGASFLATPAQAGFTLTLHETGFADVVVTDAGHPGSIAFIGSFGDFTINIHTSQSTGATGQPPAFIQTTTNTTRNGVAGLKALTVTATDDQFTYPTAGLVTMGSSFTGTSAIGTTGADLFSFVSALNGSAGTTLTGTAPGTNGNFDAGRVNNTKTATSPYTLSNATTITLGANEQGATTGNTTVSPMPAPAGIALLLSGAPVLGIGAWFRRRMTRV